MWVDQRTGLNALLKKALGEPIPGGARLAYIFGSGLIFIFILQAITGVFLTLYYVPSADHAYSTVSYITKEVTSGSFLRSLHAYGSSAMVIILILHVTQTIIYGAYKRQRELLWLSGCFLSVLILGMAFTGYLLPWDQKAYFATAVGTNIATEVPLVGDLIKRFMRGGNDLGTLTLSRFFSAHVLFIPAAIGAMVSIHVYLFRKAGAAGPFTHTPTLHHQQNSEPFYPKQLLMDLGLALLLIAMLSMLAHFHPYELGPQANPADTHYLGRPEWYYRPVFQWLKYWKPPYTAIGILVIPLVVAVIFAALPFLDRHTERHPSKRPIVLSTYAFVLALLVLLGRQSYLDDSDTPAVLNQMTKQELEVEEIMSRPFEPEVSGVIVATTPPAVTIKGRQTYELQACDACHGHGGSGGPGASKLTGIGSKYSTEQLMTLLKHPDEKMIAGGMIPSQLRERELKALVEYLRSLK